MRRLMLALVLIALMALLAACTPPPVASIDAEQMQWKTDGGGQIAFTIDRNGSSYAVYVSSYAFEDRNDRFFIAPETGPVIAALSRVMQDQGKFHLNDSDAPTGSWTTLQFSDGEDSITFDEVIVEGDLALIYDYIVAQIKSTGKYPEHRGRSSSSYRPLQDSAAQSWRIACPTAIKPSHTREGFVYQSSPLRCGSEPSRLTGVAATAIGHFSFAR